MPFAGSMNIQASFGGITANNIDSGAADSGDVLTADGSGGAAWQAALGGTSYKVYTALLTQSGENAPVATVLENTLGGEVVWTHDGSGDAGMFLGTLSNAFTTGKTAVIINSVKSLNGMLIFHEYVDANSIRVVTGLQGADPILGVLENTFIEIRVYP